MFVSVICKCTVSVFLCAAVSGVWVCESGRGEWGGRGVCCVVVGCSALWVAGSCVVVVGCVHSVWFGVGMSGLVRGSVCICGWWGGSGVVG